MRLVSIVTMVVVLGLLFRFGQPAALQAIHVYQRSLAPLVERLGVRCRFTPSCSRYAETVIARDGLITGGWMALLRIGRCGPWTTEGTPDPP